MSKINGVIIFSLGAAVGSAVTWRYTKNFYEKRAQEEIDSVKDSFGKRFKPKEFKIDSSEEKADVVINYEEKPDILEYAKVLENEGYKTSDKSNVSSSKPYVISPDEFGDIDDYDQVSLTYYADEVLADENDDQIIDVDDVVGSESLTHFGEYEDDSVFVRNDRLKIDYEILMDARPYSEVLKHRPHKRED